MNYESMSIYIDKHPASLGYVISSLFYQADGDEVSGPSNEARTLAQAKRLAKQMAAEYADYAGSITILVEGDALRLRRR